MQTRDGALLRADAYRPATSATLPVLLQRTPYGKAGSDAAFALMAAERGYAVVIQDTRGRWESEGDGYPLVHEKADGYDAVEWAARQPWSNGKVGMFGASYVGYTQLAAASQRPPSLKCIAPMVTFCDPYDGFHFGGAAALGVGVSWTLLAYAQLAIQKWTGGEAEKAAMTEQLITLADGMARGATLRTLPLADLPLIGRGGITGFFLDLLLRPERDAFWQPMSCRHADIGVPALHLGGWYDLFAQNTLRDWAGLRASAAGDQARAGQKLIVGPWLHGPLEGLAGEVDFGLRASSALVAPNEIQLRWFDHWLKGADTGMLQEPPVSIFVMGNNAWRTENEWPLARMRYEPCFLRSGGAANTRLGDGALSWQAPGDEPVDSFVYDPRNPVPTRGGGLCCYPAALPAGAYDQREIESRPDVLVYSTEPLPADLEVTGEPQARLWAATSAPDTDFTVKLVDVGPCGYARNLCDGIIRARYRLGDDQPRPIAAGEAVEYEIHLPPVSNVFKAGHRLRIEVSSSNFPRFDRNLNTGHATGTDAEARVAVQTVLHDASHPSRIILPVVP
jgi:putative CocE/NonD family hydrolase